MTSKMRALFETLDRRATYALKVRGSEGETPWMPVPPMTAREVADVLPDTHATTEPGPRSADFYAVKISIKNDGNGNPRRGWLVYAAGGALQGFAVEGYSGTASLDRAALKLGTTRIEVLCELHVEPREYRTALKHERLDIAD